MSIKNIINKPFPLIISTKSKIIIIVSFSIFVYIFLMIFQPFGISTVNIFKPVFILGHSFIVFIVMVFSYFILPLIFKSFFKDGEGTIGKMFVFLCIQIIAISIIDYFYINILSKTHFIPKVEMSVLLIRALAIAILPVAILLILTEHYLLKEKQRIAKNLTSTIIKNGKLKTDDISIRLKDGTDIFTCLSSKFICAKASGNYIEFYYLANGLVEKKLIRCSLSHLDDYLKNQDCFVRCHKSYIVNSSLIESIKGNSRNFTFSFQFINFVIPVSRSFPKKRIEEFKLKTKNS